MLVQFAGGTKFNFAELLLSNLKTGADPLRGFIAGGASAKQSRVDLNSILLSTYTTDFKNVTRKSVALHLAI